MGDSSFFLFLLCRTILFLSIFHLALDNTLDPTHERPEQSEIKKKSSLQDTEPATHNSVRAITNDKRDSYYHSETCQTNQRKIGSSAIGLRGKEAFVNEEGTISEQKIGSMCPLHFANEKLDHSCPRQTIHWLTNMYTTLL